MRRACMLLVLFILFLQLFSPALAVTEASEGRVDAVLDRNGDCQVAVSLFLQADQAGEIWFPIPSNARSVSINGSGASTSRDGGLLYVDLSDVTGGVPGSFTISLRYTVPNTVSYTEEGYPLLQLPLLSGFAYPIRVFDFSLTLPEPVQHTPSFSSSYHLSDIGSAITTQVNGNQITGSILTPLKDLEALTLHLQVTEDTFPRSAVDPFGSGLEDILAYAVMGLALLYWLIFLRSAPLIRRRSLYPPEGVTAGELRCVLTGQGADLTSTVFSWAQLGYILIEVKRNGRVLLHKRMDMGNERGAYEQKLFRQLFAKSTAVDGTGLRYAVLSQRAAATRGSMDDLFKKSTGNPRLLRFLGVAQGVFAGASLAIGLAGDALLAVLVILLMAVAGGAAAWLIQGWVEGLHLRGRRSLWLGLGLAGLWLTLGFMGGDVLMASLTVAFQLLLGLAAAYGGRRTTYGRQVCSQVLGLRANLKRLPPDALERIRRQEPDYFFAMAPYALAFGTDRAFARQFGRLKLSPCSWLTTGSSAHLTAEEWRQSMRQVMTALDEHKKRLFFERLMGK